MNSIYRINIIFFIIIFLSIFGMHSFYIFYFGVNVPFLDQWGADTFTFRLYVKNQFKLEHFIFPHNEHRIGITRLWSILLFNLKGGYDPKFGMYAQAIILSFNAALLFLLLSPMKNHILYKVSFLIAIISVFGFPYFEENILWSFTNQFYWMQFFGILNFFLYTRADSHLKFIGILLTNLLSLFTIASGILTIISAIPPSLYFAYINRNYRKVWIYLIFFQFLLLFLGKYLLVTIPHHAILMAHDLQDILNALVKIFNWPYRILNIILCIPLLYFLIYQRLIKKIIDHSKIKFEKCHIILIALVVWVILQIIAVSYGRANANILQSRYLIIYALIYPLFITFTIHGLNKFSYKFKGIISLFLSVLIAVALGNYSYHISLPAMKASKSNLSLFKADLKEAYYEKDIKKLTESKYLILPISELIWKGVMDPDLNQHYLWLDD